MLLYLLCWSVLLLLQSCSFGFDAKTEYPFLFTIVIDREHVPGQEKLMVCAAIELVEEKFYLTPKKCFSNPVINMEMRVALMKKRNLNFRTLIFEPFVLRWETFSDYVILEKDYDGDLDVETIARNDNDWNSQEVNDMKLSINNSSTITEEPKPTSLTTDSESYDKYKAHFKNPQPRLPREVKDADLLVGMPPLFPDESDLPPRILITIPHNSFITKCFTLGWGTFFSKKTTLNDYEGLELKRYDVGSHKPGVTNSSKGFYFHEIWFERENKAAYVDDLGSPMLCEVNVEKNLHVIIGMFLGGNDTMDHEFDCYRSFMGEFYYITHWAIGTNVSVTGDPRRWTMWPIEYAEEPRSGSVPFYPYFILFEFFLLIHFQFNCYEFPKRIEEYPYIHLMVISPEYVPYQKTWRVCSVIMLVEEVSFLTSIYCFENITHDETIKVSMTRKKKPSFKYLVFEDFVVRYAGLIDYVVLQKDGFEIVVDKYLTKSADKEQKIIKNPFDISDLEKPRVLLTHPSNPRFTECFSLGWGSYSQEYSALDDVYLKFSSVNILKRIALTKEDTVLVEKEEDAKVEDLGSPLVCVAEHENVFEGSAVVAMYMGGNYASDENILVFKTFNENIKMIANWAIGTNFSEAGSRLSKWKLLPEPSAPGNHEHPEEDGIIKKGSSNVNNFDQFIHFIGFIFIIRL